MKNQISKLKYDIRKHKTLLQNFSHLSMLQIFGMLLPLITYPYLIRILEKEIYGLVVFAQTVVQYFIIFINYGFNISANQSIAINKSDKSKLSEIISSVLIIKVLLLLISFIIIVILILSVPLFQKESTLFLFSMAICIQETIFPTWYFLGTEKMKYITQINILSRIIFTSLIFIVVNEKSDYIYIPLINGIGALIAGLYSLYIVFSEKEINFKFQTKKILFHYLKDSTYFFISNLSTMLYTNASKFILGITGNMSEVAYFDIGEKMLGLIKSFVSTVEQSIFPRISFTKDIRLFNYFKKITFFIVVFICLITIISSKYIILILAGKSMISAKIPLVILVISAIPITLSTFWGHIMLLAWNKKNDFLKLKIISLASFIIICISSLMFFKIYSTSLAFIFLLNETLILFYTLKYAKPIIYNK